MGLKDRRRIKPSLGNTDMNAIYIFEVRERMAATK